MCLIITALCAAVSGTLFLRKTKNQKNTKALFTLFLMYASAALMWCVDSVACVINGEPFFDLSMTDFILGLIICGLGLCVYVFLLFIEKIKMRKNQCI